MMRQKRRTLKPKKRRQFRNADTSPQWVLVSNYFNGLRGTVAQNRELSRGCDSSALEVSP